MKFYVMCCPGSLLCIEALKHKGKVSTDGTTFSVSEAGQAAGQTLDKVSFSE